MNAIESWKEKIILVDDSIEGTTIITITTIVSTITVVIAVIITLLTDSASSVSYFCPSSCLSCCFFCSNPLRIFCMLSSSHSKKKIIKKVSLSLFFSFQKRK